MQKSSEGLLVETHLTSYPFYPVHEMGKFTQNVYGKFWVNVFGKTRVVLRLDIAGVFM